MKTWIFEIVGNHAFVYIITGVSGAALLYRKVVYRSHMKLSLPEKHERFLRYISQEISIAGAPGTNARCKIRGLKPDVQRIREILRSQRSGA